MAHKAHIRFWHFVKFSWQFASTIRLYFLRRRYNLWKWGESLSRKYNKWLWLECRTWSFSVESYALTIKALRLSIKTGNHEMIYNRAILVWNYSCDFKLNLRCALVQFWNHAYDFSPNCTPLSSITTSLQPFLSRPNTGLGQFKCFIDAVLSWFEIDFIHFLWGKNRSFENKSCKICHRILFVFHFLASWLVTLNKPWNLIGCFVVIVSSLAGKKMRFKAKNGAIRE